MDPNPWQRQQEQVVPVWRKGLAVFLLVVGCVMTWLNPRQAYAAAPVQNSTTRVATVDREASTWMKSTYARAQDALVRGKDAAGPFVSDVLQRGQATAANMASEPNNYVLGMTAALIMLLGMATAMRRVDCDNTVGTVVEPQAGSGSSFDMDGSMSSAPNKLSEGAQALLATALATGAAERAARLTMPEILARGGSEAEVGTPARSAGGWAPPFAIASPPRPETLEAARRSMERRAAKTAEAAAAVAAEGSAAAKAATAGVAAAVAASAAAGSAPLFQAVAARKPTAAPGAGVDAEAPAGSLKLPPLKLPARPSGGVARGAAAAPAAAASPAAAVLQERADAGVAASADQLRAKLAEAASAAFEPRVGSALLDLDSQLGSAAATARAAAVEATLLQERLRVVSVKAQEAAAASPRSEAVQDVKRDASQLAEQLLSAPLGVDPSARETASLLKELGGAGDTVRASAIGSVLLELDEQLGATVSGASALEAELALAAASARTAADQARALQDTLQTRRQRGGASAAVVDAVVDAQLSALVKVQEQETAVQAAVVVPEPLVRQVQEPELQRDRRAQAAQEQQEEEEVLQQQEQQEGGVKSGTMAAVLGEGERGGVEARVGSAALDLGEQADGGGTRRIRAGAAAAADAGVGSRKIVAGAGAPSSSPGGGNPVASFFKALGDVMTGSPQRAGGAATVAAVGTVAAAGTVASASAAAAAPGEQAAAQRAAFQASAPAEGSPPRRPLEGSVALDAEAMVPAASEGDRGDSTVGLGLPGAAAGLSSGAEAVLAEAGVTTVGTSRLAVQLGAAGGAAAGLDSQLASAAAAELEGDASSPMGKGEAEALRKQLRAVAARAQERAANAPAAMRAQYTALASEAAQAVAEFESAFVARFGGEVEAPARQPLSGSSVAADLEALLGQEVVVDTAVTQDAAVAEDEGEAGQAATADEAAAEQEGAGSAAQEVGAAAVSGDEPGEEVEPQVVEMATQADALFWQLEGASDNERQASALVTQLRALVDGALAQLQQAQAGGGADAAASIASLQKQLQGVAAQAREATAPAALQQQLRALAAAAQAAVDSSGSGGVAVAGVREAAPGAASDTATVQAIEADDEVDGSGEVAVAGVGEAAPGAASGTATVEAIAADDEVESESVEVARDALDAPVTAAAVTEAPVAATAAPVAAASAAPSENALAASVDAGQGSQQGAKEQSLLQARMAASAAASQQAEQRRVKPGGFFSRFFGGDDQEEAEELEPSLEVQEEAEDASSSGGAALMAEASAALTSSSSAGPTTDMRRLEEPGAAATAVEVAAPAPPNAAPTGKAATGEPAVDGLLRSMSLRPIKDGPMAKYDVLKDFLTMEAPTIRSKYDPWTDVINWQAPARGNRRNDLVKFILTVDAPSGNEPPPAFDVVGQLLAAQPPTGDARFDMLKSLVKHWQPPAPGSALGPLSKVQAPTGNPKFDPLSALKDVQEPASTGSPIRALTAAIPSPGNGNGRAQRGAQQQQKGQQAEPFVMSLGSAETEEGRRMNLYGVIVQEAGK